MPEENKPNTDIFQPLEKEDELDVSGSIKPKLDFKKLIKDKEIEFKSVIIKGKAHIPLEDDITVDASFEADLKKSRINAGKLTFTKKF